MTFCTNFKLMLQLSIYVTHYKILKAIHEESNEGWAWIPKTSTIKSRTFIKIDWIENKPKKSKPIRCQARIIDDSFYKFYTKRPETVKDFDKSNTIIMSEYYRDRFGISEDDLKNKENEYNLIISKYDCFFQKIRAFLEHPNDVVKIATILAIISIIVTSVLGLISIILAILSYLKWGF